VLSTLILFALPGLLLTLVLFKGAKLHLFEYLGISIGLSLFQYVTILVFLNFTFLGINYLTCLSSFVILTTLSTAKIYKSGNLPVLTVNKYDFLVLLPIAIGLANRAYDTYLTTALPYWDSYYLTYLTNFVRIFGHTPQVYAWQLTPYLHGFDILLGFSSIMSGINPIYVFKWFSTLFSSSIILVLYVVIKRFTGDILSSLLSALLLSTSFVFDWVFLRTAITRAENVGLYLFILTFVIVALYADKQMGSKKFLLSLSIIFWTTFVFHLLTPLALLVLLFVITVSKLNFWKASVLFAAVISVLLAYVYLLRWNPLLYATDVSYSLSSFNFQTDFFGGFQFVILLLCVFFVIISLFYREKRLQKIGYSVLLIIWLLFLIIYYAVPYLWILIISPDVSYLIYRMKSFLELLTIIVASCGFYYLGKVHLPAKLASKFKLINRKSGKSFLKSLNVGKIVSIALLLLLSFNIVQNMFPNYITYSAVSDDDFSMFLWFKDYTSQADPSSNFTIVLVGDKIAENDFECYRDFVATLYDSRILYISKNNSWIRDPPLLNLATNDSDVTYYILNTENPCYFVVSDKSSDDLRESAIHILKQFNSTLLNADTATMVFEKANFESSINMMGLDVLTSGSWSGWRSATEIDTANNYVLIRVHKEANAGAYSLYAHQGWRLNVARWPIMEINTISISNSTYQVYSETLKGEKVIFYDGNQTGDIFINLGGIILNETLSSLTFYIRGANTELKVGYVAFHSLNSR
jgi:hypothetical protein